MKIALINPPHESEYKQDKSAGEGVFLSGVTYIESSLRGAGHNVKVVDLDHDKNASLLDTDDCDVVGISSVTDSYNFMKRELPRLKAKGKITVVGGYLMSGFGLNNQNWLMRTLPIDFGVVGEGENTARGLLEHIQDSKKPIPNGVIYRGGEELMATNPVELIPNLDEAPEIDYTKWSGFAGSVKGRTTGLHSSRGCHGSCSFCAKPFCGVRHFSPGRLERELKKLADLQPSKVWFTDDTFTSDKSYAVKAGELAKQYGIKYFIQTRADDVNVDLLTELKKSGCEFVCFGIESFDEQVRKKAGKGVTDEQIFYALRCARKAHLKSLGFFIVGLPGETRESLDKTLETIRKQKIPPIAGILMPYPGTRVWDDAVNRGMNIEKTLQMYSREERKETRQVPINLSEGLSDEELLAARDEMHRLRNQFE